MFLTVNLIDRYLEKISINRKQLQLVGITCMLIACKFEENSFPEIKDFIRATDNTYTKGELLKTERNILRALDFLINIPSSFRFFERYSRICKFDDCAYNIGLYLIEVSLIEYKLLKYKPSTLAGAAIYLSKKIMKNSVHETTEVNPKGDNIESCALDLANMIPKLNNPQFQSVNKKFLTEKYRKIAKIILR